MQSCALRVKLCNRSSPAVSHDLVSASHVICSIIAGTTLAFHETYNRTDKLPAVYWFYDSSVDCNYDWGDCRHAATINFLLLQLIFFHGVHRAPLWGPDYEIPVLFYRSQLISAIDRNVWTAFHLCFILLCKVWLIVFVCENLRHSCLCCCAVLHCVVTCVGIQGF